MRPLEWFDAPHDWSERTKAYLDGAGALFVAAAQRALAQAGVAAKDVDVIVTVSSTGIATPSLEARAAALMGFRAAAARVPVFGLGCAGGVSGLSLGARLARAEPGEVVLVVVVELCTLAFRGDRGSKADVISTALFGDGAAAVVLRAERAPAALTIGAAAEHTWPGTLDIMGWSVDPAGFGVVLSRSLPRFVEQRLAAPARRFIEDCAARRAAADVAIPAAPRCSKRSKPRSSCKPARCATSARCCANTATCRRRRHCLCSTGRESTGSAARRCCRRSARDSPRASLRSNPRKVRHMGEGAWLIAFLGVQRLAELGLAQWNTRRLRQAGAVEFGAAHYPLIVALHAFWLLGLWLLGHSHSVDPFWLVVFVLLQAARVWVIASLGRRWTTRIIVLPGAAPVKRGPYRFVSHPNYLIVILEIAVVPLALGLPLFALVFSLANAALIALRISVENRALSWAGDHSAGAAPTPAQPLPMKR